ncbi:MAG: hypothetical protein H0W72_09625 [Planctomycetes bacterium]|nr:hypothetical protein [Planctomycetota bacterium]
MIRPLIIGMLSIGAVAMGADAPTPAAAPSAADIRYALEQADDPAAVLVVIEDVVLHVGAALKCAKSPADPELRGLLSGEALAAIKEEFDGAIEEVREDPTVGGAQRRNLLMRIARLRRQLYIVRRLARAIDDTAAFAKVLDDVRGEFFFEVRPAAASDVDEAKALVRRLLAWVDDAQPDPAILFTLVDFGDPADPERARQRLDIIINGARARREIIARTVERDPAEWNLCDGEYLAVPLDDSTDPDHAIFHRTTNGWRIWMKSLPPAEAK